MENIAQGASAPSLIRQLPETGWRDVRPPSGSLTVQLGEIEIKPDHRYLLTVNDDGTPNVREIPWDAAIASQARYLEMMVEPNGSYVSTDRLRAFVAAAIAKIKQRGEAA
ncbi:MAG TPA: hypothetical protein VK165_02025 [Azonexus sp.]|nr:hypothetical protein [Azonexus sp.]